MAGLSPRVLHSDMGLLFGKAKHDEADMNDGHLSVKRVTS